MYLLGFIKTKERRVLINPVMIRTERELYTWLINFFNSEDFKLDQPITEENLKQSLLGSSPVIIDIAGYHVALMFGSDETIQTNTDGFIYTKIFKIQDYMAN